MSIGKLGKLAVEIRLSGRVFSRPYTPQKLTWTQLEIDDLAVDAVINELVAERVWAIAVDDQPTMPFTQHTWFDELIQGPAYCVLAKGDEIIAAYKHVDAGPIDSYSKSSFPRSSINHLVEEYEQHPEYEILK